MKETVEVSLSPDQIEGGLKVNKDLSQTEHGQAEGPWNGSLE
jgi:hypothetical protein